MIVTRPWWPSAHDCYLPAFANVSWFLNVGFRVQAAEQVAAHFAAAAADVYKRQIVGSAIVKMVAQYGSECVEPVCSYVRQMKAAVGGWGVPISKNKIPVLEASTFGVGAFVLK